MSLDWDLTKIKDKETVCWIPDPTDDMPDAVSMNPVTHTIIMATMSVGIGNITEKNWEKFAKRLFILQEIDGAYMRSFVNDEWVDKIISTEDVKAHIGLSTNVWPEETDTKWNSKISKSWLSDLNRKADNWLKNSKKELEIPV